MQYYMRGVVAAAAAELSELGGTLLVKILSFFGYFFFISNVLVLVDFQITEDEK